MDCYIYTITNAVNNKMYVGQTVDVKQRWWHHINEMKHSYNRNRPLYIAMNKYGIENFQMEVIEKTTVEDANEREIYWIDYLNTYKDGYNVTIGGEGTFRFNYDEIVNLYEEGKKYSEIKELIGCSRGTITRVLKLCGISGDDRRKHNKRTGAKITLMIDIQTNEILVEFRTLTEAGDFIREGDATVRGAISNVCNGRRVTAYGYKWKYKD